MTTKSCINNILKINNFYILTWICALFFNRSSEVFTNNHVFISMLFLCHLFSIPCCQPSCGIHALIVPIARACVKCLCGCLGFGGRPGLCLALFSSSVPSHSFWHGREQPRRGKWWMGRHVFGCSFHINGVDDVGYTWLWAGKWVDIMHQILTTRRGRGFWWRTQALAQNPSSNATRIGWSGQNQCLWF